MHPDSVRPPVAPAYIRMRPATASLLGKCAIDSPGQRVCEEAATFDSHSDEHAGHSKEKSRLREREGAMNQPEPECVVDAQ
ncbi:hypothetical protein HY632_05220 [Candidatus Uhrbacteria bacterium]|nr:hypothetical protein [Candidatus Uhrbacteria bacterium]